MINPPNQRRPSNGASEIKLSSSRRSSDRSSAQGTHRSPVTRASYIREAPGRFTEQLAKEQLASRDALLKVHPPRHPDPQSTWLDHTYYQDAVRGFHKYSPDQWQGTVHLRMTPFIYFPWMVLNVYIFVLTFWVELVQPSLKPCFEMPIDAHVVMGGALSFLIVFRTQASFDRWWEARCAWQDAVTSCRALVVTTGASLCGDAAQERFSMQVVAFAVSFKAYLRGTAVSPDEVGFRMSWEHVMLLNKSSCPPLVAIRELAATVRLNLPTDSTGLGTSIYDEAVEQMRVLMSAVGVCERIKQTPMTFCYIATLRSFLVLWLATLPSSLIGEYGWVAVPALSVIGFLFLTVEQMAIEIEQPFGNDANDLPLESYILDVERVLLELLPSKPSTRPPPDREVAPARPLPPPTQHDGSRSAKVSSHQKGQRQQLPQALEQAPPVDLPIAVGSPVTYGVDSSDEGGENVAIMHARHGACSWSGVTTSLASSSSEIAGLDGFQGRYRALLDGSENAPSNTLLPPVYQQKYKKKQSEDEFQA